MKGLDNLTEELLNNGGSPPPSRDEHRGAEGATASRSNGGGADHPVSYAGVPEAKEDYSVTDFLENKTSGNYHAIGGEEKERDPRPDHARPTSFSGITAQAMQEALSWYPESPAIYSFALGTLLGVLSLMLLLDKTIREDMLGAMPSEEKVSEYIEACSFLVFAPGMLAFTVKLVYNQRNQPSQFSLSESLVINFKRAISWLRDAPASRGASLGLGVGAIASLVLLFGHKDALRALSPSFEEDAATVGFGAAALMLMSSAVGYAAKAHYNQNRPQKQLDALDSRSLTELRLTTAHLRVLNETLGLRKNTHLSLSETHAFFLRKCYHLEFGLQHKEDPSLHTLWSVLQKAQARYTPDLETGEQATPELDDQRETFDRLRHALKALGLDILAPWESAKALIERSLERLKNGSDTAQTADIQDAYYFLSSFSGALDAAFDPMAATAQETYRSTRSVLLGFVKDAIEGINRATEGAQLDDSLISLFSKAKALFGMVLRDQTLPDNRRSNGFALFQDSAASNEVTLIEGVKTAAAALVQTAQRQGVSIPDLNRFLRQHEIEGAPLDAQDTGYQPPSFVLRSEEDAF